MTEPARELLVVDGRPTVRGECDLAAAAEIDDWLASFGSGPIAVDLSGVTFIDSSGLKAFLNARRRNPDLRIVAPSPVVARLLEITATHGFLVDGTDAPP